MAATEPVGSVQVCGEGGCNGAQKSKEVRPEGLPRGNPAIPTVTLDFEKVNFLTQTFASCTLIGYFLGRPPPELVLKQWMRDAWEVHGWKVSSVRYLSRGFYAFSFKNPDHAEQVLLHGPWTCRRNLVVLNKWSPDFSVDAAASFACPVWVELPGLPLPLGEMLAEIVAPLGTFVCNEPQRMYNPRPHKRACVQVDLSRELPKEILLDLGHSRVLRQPVRYLNLPNTCFRCQSADHMIKNCPLMPKVAPKQTEQATSTPIKPGQATDGGERWQTVRARNKTTPAPEPEKEVQPEQMEEVPASTREKRIPNRTEGKLRPRSPSPRGISQVGSPSKDKGPKTLEQFFSRKKPRDSPVHMNQFQALELIGDEGGGSMECDSPPSPTCML